LPIADTEVTLAKIADLDCFCCGIAKAQSFPHWHRHPELFAGQKQVIHDYLHPRGIRRGQYPYEFLAIDIKPNLPGAYTGESILGMIECGYTNEKFPFGLKSKDLELLAIQDFYAQTVVARGFKTRRIRFDKSLEQTSADVYAWARAEGMHLEFTPARKSPKSQPAENGLKLCMIGTRTLLLAGGLPAGAWLLVARAWAYVDAYLPCSALPGFVSPYQLRTSKRPDLSWVRVIGSRCFAHDSTAEKFEDRGLVGAHVGYDRGTKGYISLTDVFNGSTVSTKSTVFHEAVPGVPFLFARSGFDTKELELLYAEEFPEVEVVEDPVVPKPEAVESRGVVSDYRLRSSLSPATTAAVTAPVTSTPSALLPPAELLENDDVPDLFEYYDSDDEDDDGGEGSDPKGGPAGLVFEVDGPDRVINTLFQSRSSFKEASKNRVPNGFAAAVNGGGVEVPKGVGSSETFLYYECATACSVRANRFSEMFKVPRYRAAIQKEMTDLLSEGKLEWVPRSSLPPNTPLITSTWVVKDKVDPRSGEYERTKARLTPHGFKQVAGVNFDPTKTAAPTLHVETFHFFMALVTMYGLDLFGLDVTGAFTIPKIKELIVLATPYGVRAPDGMVLKLICSLYGTRQAAFDWYQMVWAFLQEEGFKRTVYDSCFFFKYVDTHLFLLVLYVDDFRGACALQSARDSFRSRFHARFPSTDQDPSQFIGIVCEKGLDGGYSLSMRRFFENILKKFRMDQSAGKDIPAPAGSKLAKADPSNPDLEALKFPYSEGIGEVLWGIRCVRPDLKYNIGQLCSYMRSWNQSHVQAFKHFLMHIKRTIHYTYDFKVVESVRVGGPIEFTVCTDSDFCGEAEHNDKGMHSLSSIFIFIRGCGTIMASSSLQKTLSRSTQEAEFIPQSEAAARVIALINCCRELGLPVTLPVNSFTDNDACRTTVTQVGTSLRLRHLRVAYHFIKEAVEAGYMVVLRIDTGDNPADIGTKSLVRDKHKPIALFTLKLEDPESRFAKALLWTSGSSAGSRP
jgi:hypothetical protein